MTARLLPEHIDPFRYAEQKLRLEGIVSLAGMKRLGSLINSHEGEVVVLLQFSIDEQRLPYVKGHLETMLALQCQRCLEPFNYKIVSDFVLGIVRSLDAVNSMPGSYEPVLIEDGELAIRTMIEDELILNLPIIPKHESNCTSHLDLLVEVGKEKQEEGSKQNPFHVLESLKHKQQR
jgi:uncharacterized protein